MKRYRLLDALVLLVVLGGFWCALMFSLWLGSCLIIEQRPETKAPPVERRGE